MSITEQLRELEIHLAALNQKCQRLQQENHTLQTTNVSLASQCEALLKKNDIAKAKVTQLLSQLTQMETEHV